MRCLIPVTLPALLLTAAGVAAQSPEKPEPPPDKAPIAGAAPRAEVPQEPVQGPEAAAPGESPFDYEASEQISEDLSVSFPVDI